MKVKLIEGDYGKIKKYISAKKKCFEFDLEYTPENHNFVEINRFLYESKTKMTRYRNYYSGWVLVNITEWNEEYPNKLFDAFMYFLYDKMEEGTLSCIFAIEGKCSDRVLERLEKLFEVQKLTLNKNKDFAEEARVIGFAV